LIILSGLATKSNNREVLIGEGCEVHVLAGAIAPNIAKHPPEFPGIFTLVLSRKDSPLL